MNKILWILAAGVAIGLLIAPDKGSETLRKLKDSFNDLKDHAQDSIDDLMDGEKDMIKKSKRKFDEAVS